MDKDKLKLLGLLMENRDIFLELKPNPKVFTNDEKIILERIRDNQLAKIPHEIMTQMMNLANTLPLASEARNVIYSLYKNIVFTLEPKLSEEEMMKEYFKSPNKRFPKIVRLGDTPIPKPKGFLVQEFIEENSLNVIYADAGSGKTWLMSHLLNCISTGELFLNQFKTIKGKCLYIDAESGSDEINRRFLKIDKAARDNENIFITCFEDIPFASAEFIEYIKAEQFKFILIDSLRGISEGKNENAANEIGGLFKDILKFVKETETTIAIIHHANKSDNYSGSTAIKGFIDNLFKLELIRGMKTSKQLQIKNVKNRYGFKEDIGYIMQDTSNYMISFQYLDNSQLIDDTLKAILEELYNIPFEQQLDGLTQSEIARNIGKKRQNISKYFKDSTLFENSKKQHGVILSEQGIELYEKISR